MLSKLGPNKNCVLTVTHCTLGASFLVTSSVTVPITCFVNFYFFSSYFLYYRSCCHSWKSSFHIIFFPIPLFQRHLILILRWTWLWSIWRWTKLTTCNANLALKCNLKIVWLERKYFVCKEGDDTLEKEDLVCFREVMVPMSKALVTMVVMLMWLWWSLPSKRWW